MPILIALAALLMPLTQASTAPPAIVLSPDTEARWVPFVLTRGNQIRFRMTLNGTPVDAILDTGVSATAVSRPFAARLGLKSSVAGEADAIGGRVSLAWAPAGTLAMGGLTRTGGRIAVTDLHAIATGDTSPIDMLIGADLLSCCALEIDYDGNRFRLLPSGRMPFRGTTAPLFLSRETNVYLSEATLGAQRLRPMIVDTGDGSAFTVSRAGWLASGIRPAATTTGMAYGLGGPVLSQIAIVRQLRVGAQAAREVEVRIEGEGGFSARKGTAGRIGAGFLQRYRVLLDPGAGRMVFAPGATADRSPVRSTSGLLLAQEAGRLRVLHVMRGGPAEDAGWKDGELICRVDGAPLVDAGWAAGAPGRTVRIGMCDGSERMLGLRLFY
jgi:hypothetical protein